MRYVDLGAVNALNEKRKEKKKVRVRIILPLIFGFLMLFGAAFLFAVRSKGVAALLNPVSLVTNLVSSTPLTSADGRVNVVLFGVDRRIADSSPGLTDTILVLSVGKFSKDLVMISMPRDLWVKAPSGSFSKINAVYALSGREDAVKVVSDVLGIPIHYYAVVDFRLFEKIIDILGGIEIDVEHAFDDYDYPIEGMENAYPEALRYLHVRFEQGFQKMDAKTALIYSRSRKGTNGEGTDFARAKRQQKVINAVWKKVLSLEVLANPVKMKDLYDSYRDSVETNVGFVEGQKFYELIRSVNLSKNRSVVLDDRSNIDSGGLLYKPEDSTLYGGAYVLIPKTGDYSQIHGYIQKLLFSDN
ncbi:MAG: LCP family protein [Patescibacteria group bacterium]